MKLIVGLGNPGKKYEKTRHNIGFMIVDELAASLGFTIEKKQNQALLGLGFLEGTKVLLAKPQTYMNKSGEAVLEVLNYYQDSIDDLIVIHDDLDMEFGRIRFKPGGGTGGHNGLKSITQMLNSPDYGRLKIGIGRPPQFMKVENYVLSEFTGAEKKVLPEVIKVAVTGVKTWCSAGIEKAMNDFNGVHIKSDIE
ncbi:MAG: peptidyl-tRNA hydrolase [Peptococcaceae bacterium]|jgi:PTH1 family peptidyl-tRNA hydrolase|nr:peptidyl-tRNA hydrolase [Peptococcaceae bacterium]